MAKALVIVPFPLDAEGVANRHLQLESVKLGPDIDFDFRPVKASCTSFMSDHDWALMDMGCFEAGLSAEDDGYDAVVIDSTADSAAGALRSVLDIPVIAPGRTSLLYALMLGSKFVGGQPIALPESVLVGAAKHVDAICQNVYFRPGTRYASGIMDFLERSARVTGKPQLVSEWGGFHGQDAAACECYIPLDTQTDRAQAYGRGVRLLASQPWIVGAYFYSYADHAELNWGIVDTQLTPYPEITAAIRANSPHLPDLHAGSSPH